MNYLLLSAFVLLPVLAIGIGVSRRIRAGLAAHWAAVGIAGVALIILTAIFDSLMIKADLFYYAEDLISGVRIGLAPIEDFAYPVAGVVLLPALWRALTRRGESGGGAASSKIGPEAGVLGAGAKIRALFWASRPISWINTAYPFTAAMVLTTGRVDALLVLGTLYYLIPYNLALYGINDVFDHASDQQNPRKGGLEGALLPPQLHRLVLGVALVTNLPFLVVFVYRADWIALAVLAISTFALLAYSVPGLRFKERPVLDSITSSAHFVTPAIVGFALAGAEFTGVRVLVLVAFFLWGMAAHAFGAVQDVLPDRAAGIGSIATVFGARATVCFSLLLWAAAGVLMLFVPFPGWMAALIAVPYLINCAPYARIADDAAHLANRAWRRFIWLNYGCGFLVTMLLILAVWR